MLEVLPTNDGETTPEMPPSATREYSRLSTVIRHAPQYSGLAIRSRFRPTRFMSWVEVHERIDLLCGGCFVCFVGILAASRFNPGGVIVLESTRMCSTETPVDVSVRP
jgi:hypothetical protein